MAPNPPPNCFILLPRNGSLISRFKGTVADVSSDRIRSSFH